MIILNQIKSWFSGICCNSFSQWQFKTAHTVYYVHTLHVAGETTTLPTVNELDHYHSGYKAQILFVNQSYQLHKPLKKKLEKKPKQKLPNHYYSQVMVTKELYNVLIISLGTT